MFSVANIKKPGSFEMGTIQELETPAIAFFLTLPAPMTALEFLRDIGKHFRVNAMLRKDAVAGHSASSPNRFLKLSAR